MSTTVRNVLIVVVIAAALVALPEAQDGAYLVSSLLSLGITMLLVFMFVRLYREHRTDLYGLGDTWRFALYGAVGVLLLALAGASKLWETGAGIIVWFVLVGGAVYVAYLVWRQYKESA